jgi:uncharacterized protein (DUF433 family)
MARIEISKHLVADTRVCGGRLVFRGTRIAVGDALELLAAGYGTGTVSKQFLRHDHAGSCRGSADSQDRGVSR